MNSEAKFWMLSWVVPGMLAFGEAPLHASQLADGFRHRTNAQIRGLFEDLHLANYPDDWSGGNNNWAVTCNVNGTFDENSFSQGDNGYG